MEIAMKLRCLDLRSSFLPTTTSIVAAQPTTRVAVSSLQRTRTIAMGKKGGSAAASTSVLEEEQAIDVASLLSSSSSDDGDTSRNNSKKRSGSSKGASSVPSGVRLENVSKSYKGVTVLEDVSWDVKKGEKAGLVGVNGAGKTTQLRIIAGLEEPDSGNIVRVKDNMKVAFLSQEFEVCPTRTVKEEFQSAFKEEMEISTRLKMVEKALEGSVEDQELMGRLLDELDLLQRRSQDLDVSSLDAKISKLMPTLGFASEDADRLVASFSGGWQMRMCLGKILLEEPDLLLLDEPTNHIDLDTIEWLEGYLGMQEVPMVIISHDRAFLDQLCTKIVETEMGVARTFLGNYSQYVLSKAAWIETQYTAWERQQKKIEHNKDLVNRLGGGANSGRASAAGKTLEKLQEEKVEKPFLRKQMRIRFPERGRSGRNVVSIKNLEFAYGDKMLLKKANLSVERGEKIAILGPNGCGKSTLLKLIMGYEKPTRGKLLLGEHNILPNYFEQNQAEALDLEKTVLQTVEEAAVDWRMDDIKGLLGRCNFKAEMLGRKVSLLSGGEKARLAFCKFMVKPSTLLVLDEPTNHLDIPSKEMLEEAIANYKGTVIAVSHDRYFIRQIVNRVIEVKDGHIQDYEGDYNYFLEKNLEARDREIERALEIEGKGPKAKSKVKMTKEQKEARRKQKREAFQRANQKSKLLKNAKRWN